MENVFSLGGFGALSARRFSKLIESYTYTELQVPCLPRRLEPVVPVSRRKRIKCPRDGFSAREVDLSD